MSIETFYNSLKKSKKKDNTKNTIYDIPKVEKGDDMPRLQIFEPNYIHQADLLFLPTDRFGYKYALVVVDVSTKLTDAEALKSKSSDSVMKAFKKIYNRKILKLPKTINVDAGSEFKADVTTFFNNNNVNITRALVGRHRQNAFVESKNKKIGNFFARYQAEQEIKKNDGKLNKQWVKFLPELIRLINLDAKPTKEPISKDPIITKINADILPMKTQVRHILDYPVDTRGKRLYGKFRSGDARFTKEIYEIDNIIMKPGYPIMYQLNNNDKTGYTRPQLQLIK